jgi:hypothetical protein
MIQCPRFPIAVLVALALCVPIAGAQDDASGSQLLAPIVVYNHNSSNTGNKPSVATSPSESQALSDLDEIARLKKSGMRIDYYLISASSFAPGNLHALRGQDWPDGPDAWISKCRDVGIRPGLEIGPNTLNALQSTSALPPQWKGSLGRDGRSLSLFEGGYLPDLMSALQSWYDRGIRLFQVGPIDLTAATQASADRLTKSEIVAHNSGALRDALMAFHRKNREALLVLLAAPGANPGSPAPATAGNTSGGIATEQGHGLGDIGAFQLIPTGEPQPSSVPETSVARVIDIESDGRVRGFEHQGMSLQHIESTGFIVRNSQDPNLHQPQQDWKGAFLLSMARGGWVNRVRGDLGQIRTVDALWMARVQKLFVALQAQGRVRSFGASPDTRRPYGYVAFTKRGSVYVVVNPGLGVASLPLPMFALGQPLFVRSHIQFRDSGFTPRLRGDSITLGPGQMAMVGCGEFAEPRFNFGIQQDIVIPNSIEPVNADFQSTAPATFEARIEPPIEGVLRVIVHQREPLSQAIADRATNTQPDGASVSAMTLEVTQSGRPIPVRLNGDENASSGSAGKGPLWFVAEIDVNDLTPGMPVQLQFHSNAVAPDDLEGSAYQVVY